VQCTLRRVFEKSDALFLFLSLSRGCELRKIILIILLVLSLCSSMYLFLHNKDEPRVNINTASVEALEALPGIGEVLAERIIQERPFNNLQELDNVKGIGLKTIKKIKSKAVAE